MYLTLVAVLMPLNDLKNRIYSLMPQDMNVVGDVELSPLAIVLVPEGSSPVFDRAKVNVRTYDPKSETLRQAIKKEIGRAGGWQFEATGGTPEDAVYFENKNINSTDFFKPLLRSVPAGFRLHGETKMGTFDYQMQVAVVNLRQGHGWAKNSLEARFEIVKLERLFKAAQVELKKFKLSASAEQGVQRNINHIEDFLNILRAEFWARIKLRRTLYDVEDLSLLDDLLKPRGNIDLMKEFLTRESARLNKVSDVEGVYISELIEHAA